MKSRIFSVTLLSVCLSFNAAAEIPPGKPYVEGSLGFTSYDDHDRAELDDSRGLRILGGYRIEVDQKTSYSPELSYNGYGEADVTNSNGGKLKFFGFTLGVKGNYLVDPKFDIFGRVAYAVLSASSDIINYDPKDVKDVLLGFGGEYHVNERVSVTGAYELISGGDISTLRFGGLYRF
jgi:hypothetical protein